jgi:hypothetical protein
MRSGGTQQAQFTERGLARADNDDDASGGIEEHGKEMHRARFSAKTLTSIIFHIIVDLGTKREKSCVESR